MRITKIPEDVSREKKIRETALAGCDVCPCCGETKSDLYYYKKGIADKGITTRICNKSWYGKKYEIDKGMLYSIFSLEKNKYYQVERFSCLTCGAEWESDPYTYDE